MIKILTFDNLVPPLRLAKIRSQMTTATAFSRQNDAGSRARTTSLPRSRPNISITVH